MAHKGYSAVGLTSWCVLGKVHTSPAWAIALVRALPVLTNNEVARGPMILTGVIRPQPV